MTTIRTETYDLLRSLELTTIFGNPGSTELPMLKELPEDFSYVLGLQEASVIAMADGYAQATRHAALVNLHTAPGVGNAMGNLITAYYDKTPLVITAGQQVREMLLMEPWLYNKEATELPEPYVKWSYEPVRAEDVPAAIARAFYTATQDPQGPVFVSIPMDDWDIEVEQGSTYPHSRTVTQRMAPDSQALDQAATLLGESERPAFVMGAGVERAGGWDSGIALAERTQAAVWAAPASGRANFPEDHALFQGFLPFAQQPLADELSDNDVVVVFGAPVFRYYPHAPGPVVAEGTELVQITADPDEAARAPAGTAIVGDIKLAIDELLELVPSAERTAPSPRTPSDPPEAKTPSTPAFVMHALSEAIDSTVPEEAIIVQESPSNVADLHQQIPITRSGGYYSEASGGLGWGIPGAVGIQLAQPEQQVVCVVGDGSTLYSPQALWTAVQYDAPVVVIVLSNTEYAILKSFAAFEDVDGGIPGLELPGLDFVALAQGFGCEARRIENPSELVSSFEDALEESHPVVIEVPIDAGIPALL